MLIADDTTVYKYVPNDSMIKKKTLKNLEKYFLPQFVNTIQSNLFMEWIQNQFLKDCTSKQAGPIGSYNYN